MIAGTSQAANFCIFSKAHSRATLRTNHQAFCSWIADIVDTKAAERANMQRANTKGSRQGKTLILI
jgi:hypothetical protein